MFISHSKSSGSIKQNGIIFIHETPVFNKANQENE